MWLRATWLTLVLLGLSAAGAALIYRHALSPISASPATQIMVIAPGASLASVASDLEARGLVRHALAFRWLVQSQGAERAIKAGVYALAPSLGARGVAEALIRGASLERRLTVPEGFSIPQIAKALEARRPGTGVRFRELSARSAPYLAEFPWLRELPADASLEGLLFPDTYVLSEGPKAEEELIRLMLARFGQLAVPRLEAAKALGFYRTIVMASIVEKEAAIPPERPLIAGVFFNRLRSGMPFGSDPTVEYALGKRQGAQGLSYRDIKVDSPYNTYVHPGLPPGPICNPGLASLEATLKPSQTPYLYFVARGQGRHAFTRTYAEHLEAQRRIRSGH